MINNVINIIYALLMMYISYIINNIINFTVRPIPNELKFEIILYKNKEFIITSSNFY